MLLIAVVALSLALLALLALCLRISGNVGRLDLEDLARRRNCAFIPVSEKLLTELEEWSKPIRIRLDSHRHPLLAKMLIQGASSGFGADIADETDVKEGWVA